MGGGTAPGGGNGAPGGKAIGCGGPPMPAGKQLKLKLEVQFYEIIIYLESQEASLSVASSLEEACWSLASSSVAAYLLAASLWAVAY